MHVRLTQRGRISAGAPVREAFPPTADLVILSAHDTELALVARAAAELSGHSGTPVTVSAINLLTLQDPAAIEGFVATTLAAARIVVLRLIGGPEYFAAGLPALLAWARGGPGRLLFTLPGGTVFDPDFASRGTADAAENAALWRCFAEGGPENVRRALAWLAARSRAEASAAAPGLPEPVAMPAASLLDDRPAAPADVMILFYRALAQADDVAPVGALIAALAARGLSARAVHVTSLKQPAARAAVSALTAVIRPAVILNATAFSAGTDQLFGETPVLQIVFAGLARRDWAQAARGLPPADLAMHVVLPEVDGRIHAGPVAFKTPLAFAADGRHTPAVLQPDAAQVATAADRAAAFVRLQRTPVADRRIAILVANYPNRDGRLANGVGLDTPASVALAVQSLAAAGYRVADAPEDGAALMRLLTEGLTNVIGKAAAGPVRWPLAAYRAALATLPHGLEQALTARWGGPESDPFTDPDGIGLALHQFGGLVIGVQPSRGYDVDPAATFHDPDLVPPHRYVATYLWLRQVFDAHALVHFGKHGNLEWLPGKAAGLSAACWPQALIGALPQVYPFIVNDPGEGVQAKRRTAAVIIDHLTPPLTRAELHGDLARLETLVDEHALAADLDPRRARALADEIADFAGALRLDADLDGFDRQSTEERVRRVDAHLCDLKEMQIRDGLHVFGQTPDIDRRIDLAVAIARVPRAGGGAAAQSLHRALAADLSLDGFDPLSRDLAGAWSGSRPVALTALSDAPWRTVGDAVERIERLARDLVAAPDGCDPAWQATAAVLEWIGTGLMPALEACASAETGALVAALDGRAIAPGPAGAPTRGRPDVVPTGRNFFAVDPRAVPSPVAWRIGFASAEALVRRHHDDTGRWLRTVAFSAWGTANMRTGGDDVAQALALIGCEPIWEDASGHVTGFAVIPPSVLRRPRVDVTFRASGLFRDAFPHQLDLIDSAVRAVAALDEPAEQNPIAAHVRAEARRLVKVGVDRASARRRAATRVYGPKPEAYGAGLQALIDSGDWHTRADLAAAYLAWGGFSYGGGAAGDEDRDGLTRRLAGTEAVLQAQDNREHDILDSDDYYQFMGGLAATVETLSGAAPAVYLTDTSRPEDPLPRTLAEEIARVVRGRAANPKWIAGVLRHGHKGGFEMAATVDYLFAFAATTSAVQDHHFDQLFEAYLLDERVRAALAEANPAALREMGARFGEAIRRGFWRPRTNTAGALLDMLAQ
jgi:cobaltochelatase CobN